MSSAAAPRAAIASLHRGRPYVSLRGRSEFARVYRNGKRYRRGRVVMVTTVGAPGPPQVAFVAGRRVGNAVVRNRAKRRLREATARVKLCEDTAYVVVAQRGLNDAPFDDLVEWVGDAADRGSAARSAGEQPMAAMEDET